MIIEKMAEDVYGDGESCGWFMRELKAAAVFVATSHAPVVYSYSRGAVEGSVSLTKIIIDDEDDDCNETDHNDEDD